MTSLTESKFMYKQCETCLQYKAGHTRIRNHSKILLPITAGMLAPLIANESKTKKETKDTGTQTDSDDDSLPSHSDKSDDEEKEDKEYEIID